MSGCVRFARYIRALIALKYGTLDQEFLHHLLKSENGLYGHQLTIQLLECSKNERYPFKQNFIWNVFNL